MHWQLIRIITAGGELQSKNASSVNGSRTTRRADLNHAFKTVRPGPFSPSVRSQTGSSSLSDSMLRACKRGPSMTY